MQKLADFFEENYPDLKGFNRRGLYRMKQFYELYKDYEKVSPLVTQLNWTNHLKIMSACKTKVTQIYSKASVKMKRDAIEKLAGQKTPLPETDPLAKTKDWVDDRDLMSWLNSLGH